VRFTVFEKGIHHVPEVIPSSFGDEDSIPKILPLWSHSFTELLSLLPVTTLDLRNTDVPPLRVFLAAPEKVFILNLQRPISWTFRWLFNYRIKTLVTKSIFDNLNGQERRFTLVHFIKVFN